MTVTEKLNPESVSQLPSNHLIVPTERKRWVIPYSCELLKALINQQQLTANHLAFSSAQDCQSFIKQVLLLAAQDECRHAMPSDLAILARTLIAANHQLGVNSQHSMESA